MTLNNIGTIHEARYEPYNAVLYYIVRIKKDAVKEGNEDTKFINKLVVIYVQFGKKNIPQAYFYSRILDKEMIRSDRFMLYSISPELKVVL